MIERLQMNLNFSSKSPGNFIILSVFGKKKERKEGREGGWKEREGKIKGRGGKETDLDPNRFNPPPSIKFYVKFTA